MQRTQHRDALVGILFQPRCLRGRQGRHKVR
jgi:hypothetical protein